MAAAAGGAGMGGYAQAMMGVADMLTGASADAAYEAAYGTYYQAHRAMQNAANARSAAEANIASIQQDKINTNKVIAMQQDQAKAQALVSAAVSGTSGGSVEASIHQTEVNSVVAQANNRKKLESQIENQLAQVYKSQQTMLDVDNPQVEKISLVGNLASAAAQYIGSSGNRAQFMDGVDKVFASGNAGDIGIQADNSNPFAVTA